MQETIRTKFTPENYDVFEYTDFALSPDCTQLVMTYTLRGKESLEFVERIELPHPDATLSEAEKEAISRVARLAFLAAGLSYYKTAVPAKIKIMPVVTGHEVVFLTELIANGMTEFAYVNNMPRALHPTIEANSIKDIDSIALPAARHSQPLVPVGGGKDSIVTFEALRSAGFEPVLFSVNEFPATMRTVKVAKLAYRVAQRHISPVLLDANERGALNGHVPVTAMVTYIAVLAALLGGQRVTIFSNERSASVGNTIWEGIEVNHQWAKSIMAERLLSDTLYAVVSPDIQCFSLLRPFSELRITRQFAQHRQYHRAFTSCNRAFLFVEDRRSDNWCGNCPKCRFVFLMLAPYISKSELEAIFSGNLLEDGTQLAGFRELLGIEGHKPLECVGEIEESRLALRLVSEKKEWQEVADLHVLMHDIPEDAWPTPEQAKNVFAASHEHFIPEHYAKALDEIK
jgi:hypothetical protein